MNDRALETIARGGELLFLTKAELRLDEVPLTIGPWLPRKVRAWVRFGNVPVRVDAGFRAQAFLR